MRWQERGNKFYSCTVPAIRFDEAKVQANKNKSIVIN